MIIQSYFDASGKTRDRSAQYLTLAGYSGTEDAWSEFGTNWGSILQRHEASYFHCKEAIHARGEFIKWSKEHVRVLMKELINVLAKINRQDLLGFSCIVALNDYAEVKSKIPNLRPPEHLCLDHCIGCALRQSKRISQLEIFFDRDEPFDHALRAFRNKGAWWSESIADIGPINVYRDIPAIQAADLLAWLTNRYWTKGPNDEWAMLLPVMFIVKDIHYFMFDEKALLKAFDKDGNYKRGVKIPAAPIQFPG